MKTEDQAWRDLHARAAQELHTGFADRVLRAAHGPKTATWLQLRSIGAAQIRTGFAARVVRAARAAADAPSFLSQFALSVATAALCLGAVVLVHDHNVQKADERNLADWEQIVLVAQDLDAVL